MRNLARLLATFLLASSSAAQQRPQLTVADYARAERQLGERMGGLVFGIGLRPTWLPDGRFWYRVTTPTGPQIIMIDPVKKGRTLANDSISKVPPRQRTAGRLSPDGRKSVFIREYNLWLHDETTGRETQLTTDGVKDFGYATNNAGWSRSDDPIVSWSPDSKRIATFQQDERGVRDMAVAYMRGGNAVADVWKYPLPGDSVIFRIHRVIIDIDPAKITRLDMPPDPHRSTVADDISCSGEVCDVEWYPDGEHLAFVSSSRDHKRATMRIADARTGRVRALLEETSQTQIGDAAMSRGLWHVLPASNELIWWSERDNWTHLYLYDLTTGKLKNRITTGEGNVVNVLRVDEKTRTIYFVGVGKEPGRDPYFHHFYKVGFDGRHQTLLTPDVGDHQISLSPDGRWFVDFYGTATVPPVSVLRDTNGRVVMPLERADISRLLATGWRPPTPITMKAHDGVTDIYGLMFTPFNLDSTKKYPIINNIYPGPHSGSVGARGFSSAHEDNQALAELGFVVVLIDGMGTPLRSKAFHDAYYGRLGDNTLPDQIAGMKQLAQKYSFIDIDRVGIWGHSGGGLAAAAAMLRYPDFFDVGIAESGNHDSRLYEDDWGERYQGSLARENGTDNYAQEANQTYAQNLKGKLLLVHGAVDENVPIYNTYAVADALIRAGKDFDLLILPSSGHTLGNYTMRRRWDYFVTNLLGADPPREYRIGQPPRAQ